MNFFSKNKDDELFSISEELSKSNDDKGHETKLRPDALTAEELLSAKTTPVNTSGASALDSLKKRINAIAEQKNGHDNPKPPSDQTPNIEKTDNVEEKAENQENKEKPSLLDKCKPFILDENGKEADLDAKPLYNLRSVAEILKSDSEKTIEMLSKKYDISFETLGRTPKEEKEIAKPKIPEPSAQEATTAPKEEQNKKEIFQDKIPIKRMQSNVSFVISDIDTPAEESTPKEEKLSNTATITFTPIDNGKSAGASISVSSKTRPIDLTGELIKLPETSTEVDDEIHLEKNEFEEFTPTTEFSSPKEAGKLIRALSIKKRRAFLVTFFSFFLTALFSLVKLPLLSELLLSYTEVSMIFCTCVTAVIILLNVNMFSSLKHMLSRKARPDVNAALASLTALAYAVCGIFSQTIVSDMLLLLNIILCFRSLSSFFRQAYLLSNLKQIAGSTPKTGLRLINDPAVTFAMAKTSIEGDVLIAAPQKTDFAKDYMKFSQYGTFLGGKLPIMTVISILISVILCLVCSSYFDGLVYGLYAATVLQCVTALPTIFLIENLPLYRAARKLNRKGAMIAGKAGAEFIEMANAAVFSTADIFPSGTVTLHQLKVLSENSLDDTLIRAASLTECVNSPLTPIFKKIAGTGNISTLPDSDTVKYEDRMGISGWVDNRLLFIGNRTLMEAHGIEVPSVEVDRKILRQGYFPVYVATREKACALLIIQYNVNNQISRELRKLTALGVTLLINSCDPNVTEEMVCDYFGLYNDSVKIMSAAGCHMYKNAVAPVKSISAPAVYRSSNITLASIMNCASKIKRSSILLTVLYVIAASLGAVIFAYSSLGGSGELMSETTVLLYCIISTIISYLIYLAERP